MSPYSELLLRMMSELHELSRAPVRTSVLAGMTSASERTVRKHAAQLERMGRVTRRSPKTGWLPVQYA